ncbi:MAG TPA: hypothetical protein EYM78_01620 [Gemmatimonadetes bacterium]|nr:hypothetical protein [Gemmatimonadota bacterium]
MPKWLTDFFRNEVGITDFDAGTTSPDGATRSWMMSGVEHKARRFCKLPCNNGWMSAMEGRTKPILTKLMLAKKLPIDLTADEQDQLAIWAYKTALVMDFNLEGLSDEKFISIRPSAYKRFYRSRVPPDRGVRVWTLPVRDPKAGLWWRRTQFSTYHKPIRRGKKTIPRSNLSVYLTTFGLHHSVIQVCGRLRGHAVLRFADTDPRLLQIFPRLTAKATWPGDGQTVLRWNDLHTFATRSSFAPL